MQTLTKALVYKKTTCSITGMVSRAFWVSVCAIVLGMPGAKAAPLTWTLVNVTFREGGTATGSFAYDATLGTYSSINIVTTPINGFPGETYTALATGNASGSVPASTASLLFVSTNLATSFGYLLDFSSPLTNAGGSIPLVYIKGPGLASQEFGCVDAGCNQTSLPDRFNITGSVTSVPEPSTAITLTLGTIALFVASRKRRRS